MTDQLQNKLLHYEVQPPEGAWDNIAASLNEQFSPAFTDRLYNFESIPPSDVWNKIDKELAASSEKAKVIPFFVKYRRPLKYSGAVAIFAILAILTSLLISKKTESELPAPSVASEVKKNTSKSLSPLQTLASGGHDSERVLAKTNTAKSKELLHDKVSAALEEDLLPHHAQKNETVSSSTLPSDKYMIYSDRDGNAIRLPKKIFSAFACPTEDIVCKERLQQLREKFAASAMTADFNGLLQILKSLQENQ